MNRPELRRCLRRVLLISALGSASLAVQAQQPPAQQRPTQQRPQAQPFQAGQVREQNLDFALTAGATWSDNIRLAPVDEEDGTYTQAGLLLAYRQQSQRLNANVNADVGYEYYLDDEFDNGVVGGLDGTVVFGIAPERFEWLVQDNFGQVTTDPFAAVTPETRENINYFTTGPDVFVRLGSQMRLRLNGRYSNIAYEESPLDNDRLGGGLALERELSSSSVASLNALTERSEYDDAAAASSDYERNEAFLGLATSGARTRANIELGYTQLKFTNTDQEGDGVLVRLAVDRQLTRSSSLSLTLGHEFSDAGDIFRLQQELSGVSQQTQSVLPSSDPFTNEYAALRYEFLGRRTGFGLGVAGFDESYENEVNADRTRTVVDAGVYRDLRSNLRVELLGTFVEEDARNAPGDYRENSGVLGLSWQASAKLSIELQFERADRDSDVDTSDYVENRSWLGVRYGNVPARAQVGVGLQ